MNGNKFINKDILYKAVGILIVLMILYFYEYQDDKAMSQLDETGVYVIGKLTKLSGKFMDFEFNYKNENHIGVDRRKTGNNDLNKRFFVKIDPRNLKNNRMYTDLPVPDCIRENPPEGWPEIPDCNAIGGNWYQQIADAPFDAYNFRLKSIYRKEKTETNLTQQFNPVVIRQEMLFYKSEKLVNQMTSPAITVLQRLASGEKIEILDNVIKTVKYIKGNGSPIYAIEGFGGCEKNCSHLKLLYNNMGQQLYLEYIKDGQVLKKEGDEMKELENFGIKHDYSNIKVLKEYNMYPF